MIIRSRIINAWMAFTGKPSAEARAAADEIVSVKSELARLSLDLREAQETIQALRGKLQELESRTSQNSPDGLEGLFGELAAPLSQLRLQDSLIGAGKEISGTSVMTLARHLMNAIETAGLEPIGTCGEEIPFDPGRCGPLSADRSFAPGEPVVVRFVGYRYHERVIRKALVEEARR
jgi:molecular chaperone GrpE (heat shock protein)